MVSRRLSPAPELWPKSGEKWAEWPATGGLGKGSCWRLKWSSSANSWLEGKLAGNDDDNVGDDDDDDYDDDDNDNDNDNDIEEDDDIDDDDDDDDDHEVDHDDDGDIDHHHDN